MPIFSPAAGGKARRQHVCGIAGLVDLGGLDPLVFHGRAQAGLQRLRRRGPDGDGIWLDPHCGLVHTRLAVIDLTQDGAQPMRRGRLSITFNGEIFNYRDIQDELIGVGHHFRSRSDTEVLLAGWQQWGRDLLPRLVGMFSFAIWDAEARTLHAARDRFGEKPFIYAEADRRLAFGSDLIACEAMLGERRSLDPAALRSLFALRFIPEPHAAVCGVRKLPAGHYLRFDRDGVHVSRWYEVKASGDGDHGDEAALRSRFDAAVRHRLVADVPVGVFLSSGLDSSLVAASVADTGARLKTFTVGFDGASEYYEERPMAAAVARHLGADHSEISVSFDRAGGVLERVFEALDEPFADSSAVPTFLVSEATRRAVTVVLTGDGADEVFAGYRRYWSELFIAAWQKLPVLARKALKGVAATLPQGKENRLFEISRRACRFVSTAETDPVSRQAAWMRLVSEDEGVRLFGPPREGTIDVDALVEKLRSMAGTTDDINAALVCDMLLGLPGDMLVKVDRMSMTHALETRAPFLDQRVVEWSLSVPGRAKIGFVNGKPTGKIPLRNAFRDRLPAEVFSRPKRGFEMPVAALLSGAAADRLAAATDETALRAQGIFNPDVVRGWTRGLTDRRDDAVSKLWTLLAFQEWARLHRRPEALQN